MPSNFPSTTVWHEAADMLGCDMQSIRAVFEVEAGGKFYASSGALIRRFEPHHFTNTHWSQIGFSTGGKAPWRASLAISKRERARMFDAAETIDAEACYDATSWGAPQVMGFNAELAGHNSAIDMVKAFEASADNQVMAFASFVINAGLDGAIRSHDWYAFASGYNGSGKAADYASKIESAYRRQSGGQPSSTVLRIGSKGAAVEALQRNLAQLKYTIDVDGHYGQQCFKAVRDFQRMNGLNVDGIAGAQTQKAIENAGGGTVTPERAEQNETTGGKLRDKMIERGSVLVTSGGAAGLLGNLNELSQTLLIGGIVVGGIAIAVLLILKKRK